MRRVAAWPGRQSEAKAKPSARSQAGRQGGREAQTFRGSSLIEGRGPFTPWRRARHRQNPPPRHSPPPRRAARRPSPPRALPPPAPPLIPCALRRGQPWPAVAPLIGEVCTPSPPRTRPALFISPVGWRGVGASERCGSGAPASDLVQPPSRVAPPAMAAMAATVAPHSVPITSWARPQARPGGADGWTGSRGPEVRKPE